MLEKTNEDLLTTCSVHLRKLTPKYSFMPKKTKTIILHVFQEKYHSRANLK